ncbi:FliH/SctL family protein [Ammoniphilus sp. CFH 90114]|uniref:FliH/SctL family protein n=1 Tax=Ammoniphilus sp. CFH 90114 TaxID=2493665 RepID=UPI00100F6C7A|nr:FliH/SctL family protein [Ammoniphilus sp. CFH 90114]RXT15114.1 hypothetical protein EIZ39_02585 [Ammoniphilus sp. CFH 90114]
MSNIIKAPQYGQVGPERPKSNVIRVSEYLAIEDEILITNEQPFASGEIQLPDGIEQAEAEDESIQAARQEAEELLAQASREAEEIVQQALTDAEMMRQQVEEEMNEWWSQRRQADEALQKEAMDDGYRQGFAQGHAQGYESAWEEQQIMVEQARQILEQSYTAKERWIQEAEPFIITMSMAIARKVIKAELSLHPEKSLAIVQEALKKVQEVDKVTICIGPESYSFLEGKYQELKKMLSGQAELLILPDYSIEEGGCVIRSAYGSIDAKVDSQLEEISKALMALAKGRNVDG